MFLYQPESGPRIIKTIRAVVSLIMIVGKNTCKLRLYRWSKEQADKVGIPMINFVEHFPNRLEYVAERIGRYL